MVDFSGAEYYFKEAWKEAEKSQCLKKKVGAVLVDLNRNNIIGIGHGHPEKPCVECVRKKYDWQQDGCWAIHSELHVIFDYFKRHDFPDHEIERRKVFNNCVMFVTHGPCDQCIKYMIHFGVSLVIYDIEYHNDYSKWDGQIKIMSKTEALENGIDLL